MTPFLRHVAILFPHDARVLLNYLKFMVQRRGRQVHVVAVPSGRVPGNGKSFIESATMEYMLHQPKIHAEAHAQKRHGQQL